MITTSRILNTTPRSHLYGKGRDYHRARPGHSARPEIIVSSIQEEDARHVPGDLLAEWDILFHADTTTEHSIGDLVARRTVRRARHSRTSVLDGDSHPIILLATDIPRSAAADVWQRVFLAAERGGTLSDVLLEADTTRRP
ncbi:hypothetical protein [Gordonia sp. NB41Y]|uniref:hypothetical protein n=1 Tax=Gordonia sp. NB41Y TaxID=875808 RepID=UPI0002BEE5DB|nr:hypothetical protein [Gordonia sp. NB41Y]EMP09995.1 hypothetical protein ISGA_3316 [Gordonia sp. NB41Y]WLP90273.1 hypothetical protein Q9K23_22610 [Gordonia sp. NB41Y]